MHCIRRYLPPLLILLPLIFICGKLLLTPVIAKEAHGPGFMFDIPGGPEWGIGPSFETGWPLVYRRVEEYDDPKVTNKPLRQTYFFSLALLLTNVVMLLLIIGATIALLSLWRRRTAGRWQFSIRVLLILVAVAAVGCGLFVKEYNQWKLERRIAIAAEASDLFYSRYVGPDWLRRLWPEDSLTIFHRFHAIDVDFHVSPSALDAILRLVQALPNVDRLTIGAPFDGPEFAQDQANLIKLLDDATLLPRKADLSVLKRTDVRLDRIPNPQLSILLKAWSPELRRLELDNCNISPAIATEIGNCQALEEFTFNGGSDDVRFPEAGFFELMRLKRLRKLDMPFQEVAPEIEAWLKTIPELE